MTQNIHFISGLPRSGSTLLAAILKQNPRFHAAMSTPVANLCNVLLNAMGANSEFSVFFNQGKKESIVRGVFENYYSDQTGIDIIFDTNRMWCSKLPVLKQLYPDAKILCCVRSVAWILDSFECLVRRNAFDYSKLFSNDSERGTVYTRCESLTKYDRVVGFAWAALKEAFYGEHASSLLLIDYDILTRYPQKTIDLIYQFLEEEPFPHDFNDVEYNEPEFDQWLGAKGLHKVRGKVEFRPRNSVLPPDLFAKYEKLSFWKDQRGSRAHVINFTPVNQQAREKPVIEKAV